MRRVLDMAAAAAFAEYRFFATAISLQNQTGGTLSETLENLADVIRKRVALAAKGKALASEARTSAMVLAALPIVTGGWRSGRSIPAYIEDHVQGPDRPYPARQPRCCRCALGIFTIRTIIRKSLS